MIFIFLKSEACFSLSIVRLQVDCAVRLSVYFFFLPCYYDLHRGYHEKRVCIYLPRSLPSQPSPPTPTPTCTPCSCFELFEDGQPVVFYDECQQFHGAP